jgi:hypothetical protein
MCYGIGADHLLAVCACCCMQWIRTLVLLGGLSWAGFATVPFIGKTVSEQ